MVTMDATAIDRATDHVALTALLAHVEDLAAHVRARRDVVRAQTVGLPTAELRG